MLSSILFALSFFTPLSLALTPPRRDPLHIPVIRRNHAPRRGGEVDVNHYAEVLAGLRIKYNYGPPRASRRAQTSDIEITNQGGDVSYFAQVNVGTPSQPFALVLDTGSSDLWFATSACASCPSGTPEFDPTSSSSFQLSENRISLKYGSGEAAGIIARDTITMGPFTVAQQIFVAVTDVTSGLIQGELAGIMGLAFQGIASSTALPFWQALINDNLLTNQEFSFFITRFTDDPTAQEEEPGGVLTLGGTNSSLYQGDIDFRSFSSPIPDGSFWLQTVTGVLVNGQSISLPSGDLAVAAIDTGTTLIGGPTDGVDAIWGAVPGSTALGGNLTGYFSFPCKTQLTIAISFGGPSWPISLADLTLGTLSNGQCMGAIFDITQGSNVTPGKGNPAWIIGDTFLKNVYSVYRANPPAVGFAQLSNAAGGSSGTPLPGSDSATSSGGAKPTSSSGGGSGGSSSAYRTAPVGGVGVLVTSALALLATAFTLVA